MPGAHFYIVSGLLAIIAITTHIAVDYVMEGTILKRSDFQPFEKSNIDYDYKDPDINVKFIDSNWVFKEEHDEIQKMRNQKITDIYQSY